MCQHEFDDEPEYEDEHLISNYDRSYKDLLKRVAQEINAKFPGVEFCVEDDAYNIDGMLCKHLVAVRAYYEEGKRGQGEVAAFCEAVRAAKEYAEFQEASKD